MKPLNIWKPAHCRRVPYDLAVLVVLSAIFFLSAGGALAKSDKPVTYYVNAVAAGANDGTSWDDAFTDLQSALDEAGLGDEIWVAAGIYTPSVSIDDPSDPRTAAFILKSGVKIYGGFAGDENQLHKRRLDPGLTVLSGDIGTAGDDTDNSYHVVYTFGVTEAVLDGFTVTGGRADWGGNLLDCRDNNGGGMYNDNSALTVSSCIFSDNSAFSSGGGMYNNDSALTVSGCTFNDNEAGSTADSGYTGRGGGMYNKGRYNRDIASSLDSSSIVTGCTFNENWAHGPRALMGVGGGGAMYNEDCAPTVDSCTFARNYTLMWVKHHGGAMLNFFSEPTITNCVFNANTSWEGGGMANIATFRAFILNCTFYGNGRPLLSTHSQSTAKGGAIYELGSAGSQIRNVIFSGNVASGLGCGAVYTNKFCKNLTLTHCLFYENEIDVQAFTFTMSDLVYDLNPLLADPEDGDFHLMEGSPCIDAGFTLKNADSWVLPLPNTDFEGDKRVIDGDGYAGRATDIGADEYKPSEN